MTSIPPEYYTSPPPPAPGLRRSSISSTVSWDSSCDSSLPSTPGVSTNFAYHQPPSHHQHAQQKPQIQQQSFTDSLLSVDDDIDDTYSAHSIVPKFLSLHQYPHPHPQHQQSHPLDDNLSDSTPSPRPYSSSTDNLIYTSYPTANLFDFPPVYYYPTAAPIPVRRSLKRKPASSSSSSSSSPAAPGRLPLIVSSDDKAHVCTTCHTPFKRLEHLRRHERKHTDERPFPCDVCGRLFSRTDNLKMHRRTHMKKKGRNLFVPGLE